LEADIIGRDVFAEESLIYIPPDSEGRRGEWLALQDCIWDSHPALQKTTCLSSHYPNLSGFFRGLLDIKSADMSSMLSEAEQISLNDDLGYIANLFKAISTTLRDDPMSETTPGLSELAAKKIFPVKYKCSWGRFDELRSCSQSDVWFIADRPHLRQSFQGLTHLFAFSFQQSHDMFDLLEYLDLGERLLSVAAAGSVDVSGVTRKHRGYSYSLRSKAHVIARYGLPFHFSAPFKTDLALLPSLAKETEPDSHLKVFRTIKSIDVYEAAQVVVQWSARSPDGSEIHGRVGSGRVKIVHESAQLSVYLAKEYLDSPCPPLELTEELSDYLGIRGTARALLLQQVLMESDVTALVPTLEGQGVIVRRFEEEKPLVMGEPLDEEELEGFSASHEKGFDQDAQDKMKLFVAEIEQLTSIEGLMDRSWMATQTDRLFSRICRIDDQDPALFLPTESLDTYRKSGLGLPDEKASWSFQSFRENGLDWKKRHPNTDILFEALYLPRTQTVFVSSKNVNNVTEEIAFLGEYAVSARQFSRV